MVNENYTKCIDDFLVRRFLREKKAYWLDKIIFIVFNGRMNEQAPIIWDFRYRAYFEDGTETSMKNACQTCGFSLSYCRCYYLGNPAVVVRGGRGSEEVSIELAR